jgi:radical SAM protein with 4Fe4S-binding SPASM domain
MKKLLLQLHITDHCNCRCAHCYQEHQANKYALDKAAFIRIIEQFKELLSHLGTVGAPLRGQITVTGGEPFMHPDFFKLLELFAANRQYFDFAILTNGTLIDKNTVHRLKGLRPLFVQVSIEGTEATHDKIRGLGNYKKTVTALRQMVAADLCTIISFTAHRDNYLEFTDVAKLGRKLKVDKVWADRHIPMGQGASLKEEMLTAKETQEFFTIMKQASRKSLRHFFAKTQIGLERGLQFLVGGGNPYHCSAGSSLITLMPNGDVYPCRRMPILSGNVFETSLTDIYMKSPVFQQLRSTAVCSGCEKCLYAKVCGGGLHCLAYAVYKDYQKADPGCWYSSNAQHCLGE